MNNVHFRKPCGTALLPPHRLKKWVFLRTPLRQERACLIDARTKRILVGLSGASKAFVKGTAVDADYSTSGAANVNAEKCVAQRVSASASGASKVNCHAVASLKVDRSGAASIGYKGNPKMDVPSAKWLHKL